MLFFIKRNVMFISKRSLPSVKNKSNDIPEILFILNETKVLRFRLLRFLNVFFGRTHRYRPYCRCGDDNIRDSVNLCRVHVILPLISILS